jgi:hypothetical protein
MLSSFVADSVARTRIAKTDVKTHHFLALPVPPWRDTKEQRRIGELTARLTCLPATAERPWADYTELAAAVGLTPEKDGLVAGAAREEAEMELNALAAEQYGLGRKEFAYLMDLLFMTKDHAPEHRRKRDAIVGKMKAEG